MTDIFAPHSGQNFGEPSGWWPQPVQVSFAGAVGAPHSGQNLALHTSAPHAVHFTRPELIAQLVAELQA